MTPPDETPQGRRILLVEDALLLDQLAPAFVARGWTVEAHVTGRSAIDLVWRQSFDALVTAVRLPDMRGDVVYFGAGALWPRLRSRAVFLANDTTEAGIAQAASCPCLLKPVTPESVTGAVDQLFGTERM